MNQLDHFGKNWLLFSHQMNPPAACLQAKARRTKRPMNV